MPYWSAHTHSRFSAKDALPTVGQIVNQVADYGQLAIGLTDHGTVAGIWQLYTQARKRGLLPFPGVEAYVSMDRSVKRPTTAHLGFLAHNNKGWDNLIGLNNLAHRNYKYKPLIDINDLWILHDQQLLEGLAVTTGCWFGLVQRALDNGGEHAAHGVVRTLKELFGGSVFVELQSHGITGGGHDEEKINAALYNIAYQEGLPIVITSDSHYLLAGDKPAHNMLKRLGSWSDDPDSAVFPGDGYHLCTEEEMAQRFDEDMFKEGVAGLTNLLDSHQLHIAELETFTTQVPQVVDATGPYAGNNDVDYVLMHKCFDALEMSNEVPLNKYDEYNERVVKELDVIIGAGFSGYILLTAQVTDYMREANIMFNTRGSASGSLVCWLLGITGVDPLKFNLSFERFLSGDRAKPPDIDLDVENERREDVLDWLHHTYACVQIGTWRELKLSDDPDDEDKGSLWVKWASMCRKKGHDPKFISDEDRSLLRELSGMRAFDGIGVGPAGVLVADDDATLNRVPLQWVANSKTMVTGPDKRDVEAAGYVKLDILGLKTLTAIRIALDIAGVNIADIPWKDPQVYRRISRGSTYGMFQLSGRAAQIGCKKLKPSTFDDLIASMALFRPAAMDSGATDLFIERRRKQAKWTEHHPIIEKYTNATKGVLLYQEQLIEILRDLGMDSDMLNATLKAVKASNSATVEAKQIMTQVKDTVSDLALAHNMTVEDIAWLEKALVAYSEYGFNKAHAVSYARMAFVTAWLAVHHSVAFWTGALTALADDKEKEQRLLSAARADNVTILGAHVNHSGVNYTPVPGQPAIRKGLLSINGVGEKAANSIAEHAPYASVWDMATRCPRRHVTGSAQILKGHTPAAAGGVVAALYEAGALEDLVLKTEEE